MNVLSYWLHYLPKFRAHSLLFYCSHGVIRVFVKTDCGGGQTIPVDTITVNDFISLGNDYLHCAGQRHFTINQRYISLEARSEQFDALGYSYLTMTHTPTSVGQFICAISSYVDKPCEPTETKGSLPLSRFKKGFSHIENAAKQAEQAYMKDQMDSDAFKLSQGDEKHFHEFELRKEPLYLYDADCSPSGGFNPFWGWWHFT